MGAITNDPFANIDENEIEETHANPKSQQTDPQPKQAGTEKPGAIKAGGKSAFRPAESFEDAPTGGFESFDEDTIFDFIGDAFDQKMDKPDGAQPGEGPGAQQRPTFANTPRRTQVKQVIDPEEANIGAVMYVELLEMVTIIVCEWISGMPGAYRFRQTLKEKHAEMAARLMLHENVYVSPMTLFLLSGIVLLGGSVLTAFKDKKKRVRLAEFSAKSNRKNEQRKPGEQATLFDIEPIVQGRTRFAAVMDEGTAYYTEKPSGGYCKKADREEVPPELVSELFNFHSRNSAWPTKKQVEGFLKQS